MVLNDITLEYKKIHEIIACMSKFAEQAENIVSTYSEQIKTSTTTYFKSTSSNPTSELTNNIGKCMTAINREVLRLNSQSRELYRGIALLEKQNIFNTVLARECEALIIAANTTDSITCQIIESQLENSKKQGLYNDMIDSLNTFLTHYRHISLLFEHVAYIESSLYEPLPNGITEDAISILEIKSNKECTDFSVYSEDIQNLSQFIMKLEMLMVPDSTHTIFTRRIESGSLRIVWGSKEIDLSCISDIIVALVNAIKSIASLPYELKLKKLEVQSKEIELENARTDLNAKKINIINMDIDNIIEKLGLDKNNPADKEKIQLLCLPLVDYLNSNPIGSINGVTYDLTHELLLLESKHE